MTRRWGLVALLAATMLLGVRARAWAQCAPCPNGVAAGGTEPRLGLALPNDCECGGHARGTANFSSIGQHAAWDGIPTELASRTYTFATLSSTTYGPVQNGALRYCSNCTQATPCASGGSGALARRENGAWNCGAGGGSGTVTSVGLSLPAIFSVSGSPVTTSGTLTATVANESANTFWAGPTSGGAAAAAFRPVVNGDLPTSGVTAGSCGDTTHSCSITVNAQGIVTSQSNNTISGGGSGYTTIKDETTALTARSTVAFLGAGVTCVDNSGSSQTDCTITGTNGTGYVTVQQAGSSLTARSILNFVSGATCVDNSGATSTDCTISGGGETYSIASAGTNVAALSGGSDTVGTMFSVQSAKTITGVKCYWPGSGDTTRTLRFRIWKGGTSQASVDVSASATNAIVTGTFGTSYTVASADFNVQHYATVWETSGTKYTRISTGSYSGPQSNGTPVGYAPGIQDVAIAQVNKFASGDAQPNSNAGTEVYPCEPIFQ